MQHVSNHLKNFQPSNERNSQIPSTKTSLSTTTPQQTAIKSSNNVVAHFWRAMTQMYGAQWISSFGEKANAAWTSELQKLTAAEIELGIEQCKRSGSQFVPNLPQFLVYCVPIETDTPEQRIQAANAGAAAARLRLPRPQASEEVKNAEKAKIRALLGEVSKPTLNAEDAAKKQAAMIEAASRLLQQDAA